MSCTRKSGERHCDGCRPGVFGCTGMPPGAQVLAIGQTIDIEIGDEAFVQVSKMPDGSSRLRVIDGNAIPEIVVERGCRCAAQHDGPCQSSRTIEINEPTIVGPAGESTESRMGGNVVRIGYTGKDELGYVRLEPAVFVEVDGKMAALSDTMIDLIAYHARRRGECKVNNEGAIYLPPGFQEGKRATLDATRAPGLHALES